jgi:Tfp pilus assembly PilM family ATPase
MMWLSRTQPPPLIGCEVGARQVRLAQLRPRGGGFDLLTEHRAIPAPGSMDDGQRGDAIAAALREALRDGGFTGREAVMCLPNDALTLQTLRLAVMPEGDLLAASQWKAASELGVKAEQIKSQILTSSRITEGAKNKLEVVVVSATITLLEAHVRAASSAGLRVRAIDASTCAIARCLTGAACGAPASPPQLIFELGEASATLAIAGRGDLSFIRPVGGGIEQMQRLLANRLGLTDSEGLEMCRLLRRGEETGDWPSRQITPDRARAALGDAARLYARDLAREVSLSLSYYEESLGGTVPEIAVIAGGEDLPEEARSALSLQTGVGFGPVESLPTECWQASPGAMVAGCGAWLASIGLSQYAQPLGAVEEAA